MIMKIWEVCKEENINKHYLDSNNNMWKVISVPEDSEEIELISNTDNSFISDYYYVSELLKLEFKLTNNRSEE